MFEKLFTAARGIASKAGEAVIDANALTILEQEIRDATVVHRRSRNDLATLMAHEMAARRAVDRTQSELEKRTDQTRQALEKDDVTLAEDLANQVVGLEDELNRQKQRLEDQRARVRRLRDAVRKIETRLARLRQSLVQARDTNLVHRAQRTSRNDVSDISSAVSAAEESLARLSTLQEEEDDRLTALDTLDAEDRGDDLADRLQSAGITANDAERQTDVLNRIRESIKKGE